MKVKRGRYYITTEHIWGGDECDIQPGATILCIDYGINTDNMRAVVIKPKNQRGMEISLHKSDCKRK